MYYILLYFYINYYIFVIAMVAGDQWLLDGWFMDSEDF